MRKFHLKRFGALVLSAAMSVSMLAPAANVLAAAGVYADGTYQGSGEGYLSTIVLDVTIEDGKITAITEVSQGETKEYWESATALFDDIIEAQSTEVDSVSGATYSSEGIKAAVNAALAQAEGEATVPDASIFQAGDGSEESPFEIATIDQLRAFAGSLTSAIDYTGYKVVLTADLDASDADWAPIGGQDYAFNGTFDGQGHTVANVHIGGDEVETVSMVRVGFFGKLGCDALVENLSLTAMNFNVASNAEDVLYIGGIAASSSQSSPDGVHHYGAVVDSCHVDGYLGAWDKNNNVWAGGITAMPIGGAIINCDTDLTIDAVMDCDQEGYGGWTEVGGITGLNFWAVVANCYAAGEITADFNNMTVEEQTASASQLAVGGLVGLDCGCIVNSYADVDVIAEHPSIYMGELVGFAEETSGCDFNVYCSYYNADAQLMNGGEAVSADDYAIGLAEDAVVAEVSSYNEETYTSLAPMMTANNLTVAADLDIFGVDASQLKDFGVKDGMVTQMDRLVNPGVERILLAQKVTTASVASEVAYKSGKTIKLKAKTTGNGKLTYASSDKSVATVSSKGVVTIKGNGKVTITVKAAATTSYTAASKKVSFVVVPAQMSTPTLKSAAKGQVKISWKKDAKATGYQVLISTSKKFESKKTTTYTISKAATVSKTVKKLTSKKTYYVKTRAYKTVGSKKYYGAYSSVKSVKVK